MAGARHCNICKKTAKPTCEKKEHIKLCNKHMLYYQRGGECSACKREREREERNGSEKIAGYMTHHFRAANAPTYKGNC